MSAVTRPQYGAPVEAKSHGVVDAVARCAVGCPKQSNSFRVSNSIPGHADDDTVGFCFNSGGHTERLAADVR
eukprot:11009305-Alexandrium_andersonii.AAC.1